MTVNLVLDVDDQDCFSQVLKDYWQSLPINLEVADFIGDLPVQLTAADLADPWDPGACVDFVVVPLSMRTWRIVKSAFQMAGEQPGAYPGFSDVAAKVAEIELPLMVEEAGP